MLEFACNPYDEIVRLQTINCDLKRQLKEANARTINFSNSYRALKRRFNMAQKLINGLRAINNGEEGAYERHAGK